MSLPSPWLNTVIGASGGTISAAYAGGVWSIALENGSNGAPNECFWYQTGTNLDSLNYVYQPVNVVGNVTIIAEVLNTNGFPIFSGAGVCIRQSVANGSTGAAALIYSEGGGDITAAWNNRPTLNSSTNSGTTGGAGFPYWVKLVYTAQTATFTSFTSPDGSTWTQQTAATMTLTAPLVAPFYVGIYAADTYSTEVNTLQNVYLVLPAVSPGGNFVTNGGSCQALASIETSPGNYQLMIGSAAGGAPPFVRDSTYNTFTDDGSAYEAGFVVGSIMLANPGELSELGFITADFMRVGTSPDLGVLMDEIEGTFSDLSGYVVSDPPILYGQSDSPSSLYANRYYFKQTIAGAQPPPAWCRHLQIKVDFGDSDVVMNEILSSTIWGSLLVEGS